MRPEIINVSTIMMMEIAIVFTLSKRTSIIPIRDPSNINPVANIASTIPAYSSLS
ncbi:hypothetical protein PGC35_06985 [Psychrobacillus sp. PGGUH221]|uniref:hypothetical protein n=1 Tax=Psychrobacillus sp. PGGUH221 TaxID=3020058 RepID=UPI0035C6DC83